MNRNGPADVGKPDVASSETGDEPTDKLMEAVCARENIERAMKRVVRNKGGPGADGMSVKQLPGWLGKNWEVIRGKLLDGTYQPRPVLKAEIPKPAGGTRELGIPSVIDRMIQQAILQVLQPIWEPSFSDHSFGFRPGRSAHMAVAKAREYIRERCDFTVDIDLEKFFDSVNHDRLMAAIAKRVMDKRLLKILRAFLNAGVMDNGIEKARLKGTPQGGPLSPLLSNIVLDELDHEIERRGHRFVRYADDLRIFVRSERAGYRVMKSISKFITKKLRLRVNEEKSAVAKSWERKFLGFSFVYTWKGELKRAVSAESVKRFKRRIREITRRNRGVSLERVVRDLKYFINGWYAYYGFCEVGKHLFRTLDGWIRRRLRCLILKHWRNGRTILAELRKLKIERRLAVSAAYGSQGFWRRSNCKGMNIAFPVRYFDKLGVPKLCRVS